MIQTIKNSFIHIAEQSTSLKLRRRQSRACSDDECDYSSTLYMQITKVDTCDRSTVPPSSPRESVSSSSESRASKKWADCEDSDFEPDTEPVSSRVSRDECAINMEAVSVEDIKSFDSLEGADSVQQLIMHSFFMPTDLDARAAQMQLEALQAQEAAHMATIRAEEARLKALEMRAAQLKAEARAAEEAAMAARNQQNASSSTSSPAMPPGMWALAPPGVFIKQLNEDPTKDFTTVMLRNCPNDLSRDELTTILDAQGLECLYDFVYLPMDLARDAGLGYAFVNFTSHADALLAQETMEGFKQWPVLSQKVCTTCWGNPLQGLEQHIDRYKNSPVMHDAVDDKYKPIILKDGRRQPFPRATKRIRLPRMKRAGGRSFAANDTGSSDETEQ